MRDTYASDMTISPLTLLAVGVEIADHCKPITRCIIIIIFFLSYPHAAHTLFLSLSSSSS
jgi:hypothetical protein